MSTVPATNPGCMPALHDPNTSANPMHSATAAKPAAFEPRGSCATLRYRRATAANAAACVAPSTGMYVPSSNEGTLANAVVAW